MRIEIRATQLLHCYVQTQMVSMRVRAYNVETWSRFGIPLTCYSASRDSVETHVYGLLELFYSYLHNVHIYVIGNSETEALTCSSPCSLLDWV